MRKYDLLDGLTSIEGYAFSGCKKLQSVYLPDGLTSIGNRAFEGCTDLQSIDLPDGLTVIDSSTFNGCTGLKSVYLPDNLTNIESYAFQNCESLQSVYLPDSLTSIGGAAFYECGSLTAIRVGTGFPGVEMELWAFSGVPGDVTIYYPSEWDKLDVAAKEEKLKAVQAKLASAYLNTDPNNYKPDSKYEEDTKPTETTPELPDGAKGLLEMARLFGL